MSARKGSTPWNKGKKMPKEFCEKMKLVSKDRKISEETKKKMSDARRGKTSGMKGKKISDEHKKKISDANKGNTHTKGKKLKPRTEQQRKNISESKKGEKNPNWKGGITPINHKVRKSLEYKLWREAIFKRDKYTCIWCGKKGGRIEADHIKPFALFPELRFAIDNGRTLCKLCHEKTDTYGLTKKYLDKNL